ATDNDGQRAGDNDGQRARDNDGQRAGDIDGQRAGDNDGQRAGDNDGQRARDNDGQRAGDNDGQRASARAETRPLGSHRCLRETVHLNYFGTNCKSNQGKGLEKIPGNPGKICIGGCLVDVPPSAWRK
ncbi:hypothetical protein T484DRAFT_1648311, partial [Baffinella frigidus]